MMEGGMVSVRTELAVVIVVCSSQRIEPCCYIVRDMHGSSSPLADSAFLALKQTRKTALDWTQRGGVFTTRPSRQNVCARPLQNAPTTWKPT